VACCRVNFTLLYFALLTSFTWNKIYNSLEATSAFHMPPFDHHWCWFWVVCTYLKFVQLFTQITISSFCSVAVDFIFLYKMYTAHLVSLNIDAVDAAQLAYCSRTVCSSCWCEVAIKLLHLRNCVSLSPSLVACNFAQLSAASLCLPPLHQSAGCCGNSRGATSHFLSLSNPDHFLHSLASSSNYTLSVYNNSTWQ